ncbi:hypothetical protein B2J93_5458 [Marssonina coronariae]|uniref:Protein kinase domain-containing protein n=1 Tax=Diplocarpon coronariae TaxID=2795749 RepID=A0A218YZR9_9HELO|nr:hypothetical protein JHW43_000377 [Diplocarpon mali]OWP01178.1 hypothetical protein B2J93_5458 [Marssonina coronariae]
MNRDLETHILANPATVLEQSFRLCSQAAEAVEYSDKNRVIYCDLELRNLLLDRDLDLKPTDFQGMSKAPEETVVLDGLLQGCIKAFLPRADSDNANVKTDIFALGSTIYSILIGLRVFQNWAVIGTRSWTQEYGSAYKVVNNIAAV